MLGIRPGFLVPSSGSGARVRVQNASRRRPPVGPLGEVKLKGKYLSITIHRSENELDESETPRPFPHLKRKASEIYLRVKAPTKGAVRKFSKKIKML